MIATCTLYTTFDHFVYKGCMCKNRECYELHILDGKDQCVTREEFQRVKSRLNALQNITAILTNEYASIGTGESMTATGAFSVY